MGNDKDTNKRSSLCKNSFQKPFSYLFSWMHQFVYGRSKFDADEDCKSSKRLVVMYSRFKSKASFEKKNSDSCRDKKEELVPMEPAPASISKETQFADLPAQIREFIYYLIDPKDVLSLRLTGSEFKADVEAHRGLCFKLHDGILDDLKPLLKNSGIEKLIVEHFIKSDVTYDAYFPFPHLLQVLEVNGRILDINLKFLLNKFRNLTRLVLSFQHSDQSFSISNWKSIFLYNLETLEVYSNTFGTTESRIVGDSIKSTLTEINCPNLINFILNVVGFIPAQIEEYHIWAQCLLSKNSKSLKSTEIHLKQLMHPFIVEDFETFQITNEWTNTRLQLETLHLDINSHMTLWYPILDSQVKLRVLKLAVRNQSWNRLILVLDQSADTLQEFVITGLTLPLSNDGVNTTPLDAGLLGNLKKLKIFEVQYVDSHGISVPTVIRTTFLPKTLKSLKFSNLHLKPHQALFLLMKLPLLNNLTLKFWTDSEETLAGFLTVLTFLVKFDLTTVKLIKIVDSRIRMENRQNEIERLRHTLYKKATLRQDKSELYSTLLLQRISLFNVRNVEHQY